MHVSKCVNFIACVMCEVDVMCNCIGVMGVFMCAVCGTFIGSVFTIRFCTSFFSMSTLARALALSPGSNRNPVQRAREREEERREGDV